MASRCTPLQKRLAAMPPPVAKPARASVPHFEPTGCLADKVEVGGEYLFYTHVFLVTGTIVKPSIGVMGLNGELTAVVLHQGKELLRLPLKDGENPIPGPPQRVSRNDEIHIELHGKATADKIWVKFFFSPEAAQPEVLPIAGGAA